VERIAEVLWLPGDVKRDLENLEKELRKAGREILSGEPADIGKKLKQAVELLERTAKQERSTLGAIHQVRRSKYC
jgi:hypothetical protein